MRAQLKPVESLNVLMERIVEFYRYNSFVRKRYLDAMEQLPWEEVVKDRGASFGSIRNVFLHVLDAYRRWFQAVIKTSTHPSPATAAKIGQADQLNNKQRTKTKMRVLEISGILPEADLVSVWILE